MLDLEKIRNDFPMFQNNPELIYFDNGATTFKPQCVIDTVVDFYTKNTCNVHRGDYPMSFSVSQAYDNVRQTAAKFLNASEDEIVYTKGDTDGLNQIAYSFGGAVLEKGDVILTTESEHASSILPWFRMAEIKGCTIEYVPLTAEGAVTLESFKKAMHKGVKVVVSTHVSNVLGHINPVKEMAEIAHSYNAYMIVDGAQSVPHIKTDVKDLDCDFLAFSAHKMCGPSGAGIMYGKKELLAKMSPMYLGGGSNARFTRNYELIMKKGPERFEAGTPAIEEILGMGKAMEYLMEIGMDNIHQYEKELKDYLLEKMNQLDNVEIYNPTTDTGIVSFNVKGIFAQDTASYLGNCNIAVRSGNHCAKILKDVIGTDQSIRASLYFYNTKEEIDAFVEVVRGTTLEKCVSILF